MAFAQTESKQGGGRRGQLSTKSGSIATPFFMPDATRATVRGLTSEGIEKTGTEALVVNTYHLFLQPGEDLIKKAGGIHAFMNWRHPILSDSGGYQVYSLIHKNPDMGRITENGAEFRSVLDGSKHLLTPERAIQIQFDLGVDMMVCLDDPRPNTASEKEMTESVERTLRWARRCKDEYNRQIAERGMTEEIHPNAKGGRTRPLLFSVVQGGMIAELRKLCAEELAKIGFDGYGFGGRHVDKDGNFLTDILKVTADAIPEDSIRFALGIGTPEDIVQAYALGWDMFDCVIPTREGRHGRLFIWKEDSFHTSLISYPTSSFYETINIKNEQFTEDFTPIDATCDCTLCTKYTRSYLRHLLRVAEPLALSLASEHNLRFYARLIEKLRS